MSYKQNKFQEDERPFNMAAALLMRCDLLFLKANEVSVMSDYMVWYKVLKALKRTISFKLTVEEMKRLNKKLKDVLDTIKLNSAESLDKDLDILETDLIALMFKYGLYYPIYEGKPWQEEAKEEDR